MSGSRYHFCDDCGKILATNLNHDWDRSGEVIKCSCGSVYEVETMPAEDIGDEFLYLEKISRASSSIG